MVDSRELIEFVFENSELMTTFGRNPIEVFVVSPITKRTVVNRLSSEFTTQKMLAEKRGIIKLMAGNGIVLRYLNFYFQFSAAKRSNQKFTAIHTYLLVLLFFPC